MGDFLTWYLVTQEFEFASLKLMVQGPHHWIKISSLNPGISENANLRSILKFGGKVERSRS